MPNHTISNFEIQKYYQNELKFNGIYSRNNLSKLKNGTYIIHLDEYESIETRLLALYVNAKNVSHFDSFGVGTYSKRNYEIQWKQIYYNKYL